MANNIVEYLAQLKASDPKRANWILDCPHVGTNDWGFIRPKFVREVIAGSTVEYDFKSAYSTNPTLTPLLSSGKATVCAIFIPSQLYVPALRDGVQVKASKHDYSFPVINFDYDSVYATTQSSSATPMMTTHGAGLPYIPANSIFSELRMWSPYFQPIGFAMDSKVVGRRPGPKNAIPLLGYIDFVRHFVLNSQVDSIPLRVKGYSRKNIKPLDLFDPEFVTQDAVDNYITRESFDDFFKLVRSAGANYPIDGAKFDITSSLAYLYTMGSGVPNRAFPTKFMNFMQELPDADTAIVAFNDNHYGEFRQTYKGDYFTAFLSNENVEFERSTARVVADDGGVITMDQLYHAERVQNFIRRTIFKNSDYSEFIDAQYGVTPPTNLTKPLFLGAVSTELYFNDVISTVQSPDSNGLVDSNTDLGSRASLGFGRMVTGKLRPKDQDNTPFVRFTPREPGYFMVLEWIVPDVSYYQGYDPLYDKDSLGDLFFPAFDKDGFQDKQVRHIVEQYVPDFNTLPPGIPFDEYNVAYAQEPAWWEYMSTAPVMSGQMVDENSYRNWVFHRRIDIGLTTKAAASGEPLNRHQLRSDAFKDILDIYVKPEDFNHVFANIQGLDNIQTFYKHEFHVYQPLSHRFLSF